MPITLSPLMRKYNAMRRAKTAFCAGKKTKAELNKFVSAYVVAAVAKGQTKADAQKKANKVINGKCTVKPIAGAQKRKTAKRKTTRTVGAKRRVGRPRKRA